MTPQVVPPCTYSFTCSFLADIWRRSAPIHDSPSCLAMHTSFHSWFCCRKLSKISSFHDYPSCAAMHTFFHLFFSCRNLSKISSNFMTIWVACAAMMSILFFHTACHLLTKPSFSVVCCRNRTLSISWSSLCNWDITLWAASLSSDFLFFVSVGEVFFFLSGDMSLSWRRHTHSVLFRPEHPTDSKDPCAAAAIVRGGGQSEVEIIIAAASSEFRFSNFQASIEWDLLPTKFCSLSRDATRCPLDAVGLMNPISIWDALDVAHLLPVTELVAVFLLIISISSLIQPPPFFCQASFLWGEARADDVLRYVTNSEPAAATSSVLLNAMESKCCLSALRGARNTLNTDEGCFEFGLRRRFAQANWRRINPLQTLRKHQQKETTDSLTGGERRWRFTSLDSEMVLSRFSLNSEMVLLSYYAQTDNSLSCIRNLRRQILFGMIMLNRKDTGNSLFVYLVVYGLVECSFVVSWELPEKRKVYWRGIEMLQPYAVPAISTKPHDFC